MSEIDEALNDAERFANLGYEEAHLGVLKLVKALRAILSSRPPNPEATFDATLYGPGVPPSFATIGDAKRAIGIEERPAEKCPKCRGFGEVLDDCPSGCCWTKCPTCKGSGSATRESDPPDYVPGCEPFTPLGIGTMSWRRHGESDPSATSERTEDGIRISERGDRGSEAARGGAPGERGPDGGERVPSDSSVGGRVGDALGKQPVARKSYPAEGGVARPSSGGAPDPLPEVLPAGTRFNLGNGEWEFLVTARRVPGADAPGWYSGMARHLLGITDEAHVKATSIDWSSLPPSGEQAV